MLRTASCWLLAIAALGQETPPPDPATIIAGQEKQVGKWTDGWLHSSDMRLQAWGAYLVARDRRTEAIPTLLGIVDVHTVVVEQAAVIADQDRHNAMLEALDALLELGAAMPPAEAQRIFPEFPVQSLIFLLRSSEDPGAALLAIFRSEPAMGAAWLAAGALLTEHHTGGFSAAVVAGMTVHAEVTVLDPNGGFTRGGGLLCGAMGTTGPPTAGWPPLTVYSFSGCGDRLEPGAMVLAGGTDPAYYHRRVGPRESGGSYGCNPDRDLVRQHYLTTMLSASAERPPVHAHVSHSIVWQGPDAYRQDLSVFVAEQRQVLAGLMRRLHEADLISEDEAKAMSPKLDIQVLDYRNSREPALPSNDQ